MQSRAKAKSTRGRRRRLFWIFALIVTIPAAWFGWRDVCLVAVLAQAVPDAYPEGISGPGGLRSDFRATIAGFPPRMLARYLAAPSARCRAVVCQGLRSVGRESGAGDWSGVAAALIRTALRDPTPEVRAEAADALLYIPIGAREECERLLSELETPGCLDSFNVEARLFARCCDNAALRDVLVTAWRRSPVDRRRLQCLRAVADSCVRSETYGVRDVLEIAASLDGVKAAEIGASLGSSPACHPGVGRALLESSPHVRAATLHALVLSRRTTRLPPDPWIASLARSNAIEGLAGEDATYREAAGAFLADTPEGPRLLVRALLDALPADRDSFASLLERCRGVAAQTPISSEEGERLVRLLPHIGGRARKSVGAFLAYGIRKSVHLKSAKPIFAEGAGPRSPANASIFRDLLRDSEFVGLTEPYFEHVAPLPESDVPRVASWMRASLNSLVLDEPTRSISTPMPAFPEGLFDYYRLLHRRFPTHPETKRLIRDFPILDSGAPGEARLLHES